MSGPTVHAWRHPAAIGAAGRCIGRTDLRVDARRAKRLAHRVRAFARRQGLPRIVVTSPLERCRAVGRWLARWGWRHRIDAALLEVDFGQWDGRAWTAVAREAVDAWCADFVDHAPGGGEPVASLLRRVRSFEPAQARLLIGHGGWLCAALWLRDQGDARPRSEQWPAPPRHGQRLGLEWPQIAR
jgi:alpha-ribazole phosphatase